MAYQAVDEIMARCEKDGVEFWKAVQLEDCEEMESVKKSPGSR